MSNFFDIKRFANYLVYDLRNAWRTMGLSTIVLGCLPVIIFFSFELFSLLFRGETVQCGKSSFLISAVTIWCGLIIIAPSKIYGQITEKRYGSSWIMLPASTFEKTLSMVMITCVVLPVMAFSLLFLTNWLMSMIFPLYNWSGLDLFKILADSETDAAILDALNLKWIFFLSWCQNILFFTLGAIIFKRSKPAKTILAMMILSIVLSTAFSSIFLGSFGITSDDVDAWFSRYSTMDAINFMRTFLWVTYSIIFTVLLGGIYYRLRTIKQ